MIRLHNTLASEIQEFIPFDKSEVRIYSCGPTVYDHIHIGNLSAFIAADTMRRVITIHGMKTKHVMNFTDVDDKTIARSRKQYPEESPEVALQKLTEKYKHIFLEDMTSIGNDVQSIKFVSAVASIEGMRALIKDLYDDGFAYIANDGVYFSIEKYTASGKKYGQLLELSASTTSESRIDNDEYDKESVHDFALWKTRKTGEPAWDFELGGQELLGRPGWHIECSVMSVNSLGQPFDIHTGGIDLVFPHHENEIAQSTAGKGAIYAKYFVHNEHLLVNGKKMSKSLNNFYTLQDIKERGFDPIAFRLMILQSHYRKQSNFTWENLQAAQNRLRDIQAMADLRFQSVSNNKNIDFTEYTSRLLEHLANDLSTPEALVTISQLSDKTTEGIDHSQLNDFQELIEVIDSTLGLKLLDSIDITENQKALLRERQTARDNKDWQKSDEIRDQLAAQGFTIKDTEFGQIWQRG